MKRRLKQGLALTLVIIFLTTLLTWPTALRFMIQSGLQEARKRGHSISWSGLSTGMRSASLDSLSVWIPGPRVKGSFSVPVSVELQELALAVNGFSPLSMRPSFSYSTSLYGGTLSGDAQPGSQSTRLSCQLNNIEIGKHPQLGSLGVRGGVISGSIEEMVVQPRGPESGKFSLKLRGLSPPPIAAAQTLLRTTDLGSIDVDADGSVEPTVFEVESLRLSSRFGSAAGKITAREHLSRAPSISAHFDVSLSPEGSASIGPWLPFIPGSVLDASTSEFSVNAASSPCGNSSGNTLLLNVGGGCLKVTFTKR